jgi:hypothetical protein
MITKFLTYINEELTNPYVEDTPIQYNQYFNQNYDGFRRELLDDLKNKLVGRTIYVDADRHYNYREEKDELDKIHINDHKVKPIRELTIKDIEYSGEHYGDVQYVNIIGTDNKKYRLKKIVDRKAFDRFNKKIERELEKIEEEKRRKERIKLKHIVEDPYGEEIWED